MARHGGEIRVEYEGLLSEGLREHLETAEEVRVARLRPLTLFARRPEEELNRIYRYLGEASMKVRRIRLRGASA